jgi:hypothetical protein
MNLRAVFNLLLLVLVTVLGSTSANAGPIYTQSLDLNGSGGPFSTSPSFNSNNNPHQQIVDQFRLAGNASLTDLVWYGDDFINLFAATRSFTIRLFADVGNVPANTPFLDTTVTASAFPTGLMTVLDGYEIFRFSASLGSAVDLNGGTNYWLSILDNPPSADSNYFFRWAPGTTTNGSDVGNALRVDDASSWIFFGGETAAYDLLANPVPEPPSLALLGLGLALLGLSRRKRGGQEGT